MNFGEKLKALRKQTGKTQTEVADEIYKIYGEGIRISQASLSSLEQRELPPRGEVLDIIADYFRVPMSFFYDDIPSTHKIERAITYIKAMKERTPLAPVLHAHSTVLRREKDDINDELEQIVRQFELSEFEVVEPIDKPSRVEYAPAPRELVDALLELSECYAPPVDADHIADYLNLRIVEFDDLRNKRTKIRAFLWPRYRVIGIHKNLRDSRRTFSILHEIGHFLLPGHLSSIELAVGEIIADEGKSLNNESIISQEIEANQFAADCLFLSDHLTKIARKMELSWDNIVKLASRYNASIESTARRWIEKSHLPFAMVAFEPIERDGASPLHSLYTVTSEAFAERYFYRLASYIMDEDSTAYEMFYGYATGDRITHAEQLVTVEGIEETSFRMQLFSNSYRVFGLLEPLDE